jgi:thiamine biosynthesis lipoprotein
LSKRKKTRRDFLFGKAAEMRAAAAGAAPAGLNVPAGPDDAADESSYLVRVSRPAMACEFEVCLRAGQYVQGTEMALEALDLVEQLEAQMSVFRPASEISRINLTAAQGPMEVEPRLFALLELAMQLYRQTGGAYDITAGPLWEAWGFARRAGAIPAADRLAAARKLVGGHRVELDPAGRTIRFLQPGVWLNLGSIGKGYAVDRGAERLLQAGVADFLFQGGNSSVRAHGGHAPPPAESPAGAAAFWIVGIRHPLHPEQRLAEVKLSDRALGTSGAQFQSFRHQGRRYGHILDPRSGWPAEGVLSATVLAPTAALADALSTAFYVLGPEAALNYCRQHADIAAVIVTPAAHGSGVEIHSAGLSEEQWRVL